MQATSRRLAAGAPGARIATSDEHTGTRHPSSSPPPGPKILTADGQLIGHPLAITAYRNHRRPEWLSRLSLTVGLAATALTVVVAVLIGGTTGFIGGRLDLVTQRFVDAWMAFPGLLLLLTIMSIAGRGMAQIIIVLGVSGGIPASVFRATRPKVCSGLDTTRILPYS